MNLSRINYSNIGKIFFFDYKLIYQIFSLLHKSLYYIMFDIGDYDHIYSQKYDCSIII